MWQPTPDVVAHRGASAHRAEHTRGAYELALEQGADALECDIRVSRDGHLVCVHDRRIDRTSSSRGVVSELTLAGMSDVDFDSWHRELPDTADELVRRTRPVPERGVLTLDELLALVHDHPRQVQLFVETKHPVRYGGLVEHKLVALLARYGLAEPSDPENSPVVMMSFSQAAVRRFRAAAPLVPTVLLFDRFRDSWRNGVLPPWADIAGPGIRLLREDPGFVDRAAALGRDTYCWTVDEPADVDLCRRSGVRYLATNSPGSTRSHLADSDLPRFGSVTAT
ncbi:glycerophosphodiester phosphodiesterase family protein [Saccharopolyspora sp. WRP15-2]|uniref:Glycerophosphodiester phosphodiesterase family protein n=1 Tax=Saccharopolyspora oryzae TaxID=2997343 RepID=A0ABT4V2F8_9PSEU|nr:glycerophosphodiester phosphodiesterase family protein [Saccharopolyspora oryzae]MDA3628155.1 glycerophosphodiester phosphodiesterase family protein [Saccharopolyspora oryzae]